MLLLAGTSAWASQYYPSQPKWQKSITGIRLFDILEHEVTDNSIQLPVKAVTCSPPTRAEDFLAQGTSGNKKSEPTFPVGIDLIQSRGREIKDVFKVIRGSLTGNKILDRFLPSFGYKFKVQNMNEGVRTLLERAPSLSSLPTIPKMRLSTTTRTEKWDELPLHSFMKWYTLWILNRTTL